MLLLLMPLASCDAYTSANVAPYFDYMDYTNAVVLLLMALVSHSMDVGVNDIT